MHAGALVIISTFRRALDAHPYRMHWSLFFTVPTEIASMHTEFEVLICSDLYLRLQSLVDFVVSVQAKPPHSLRGPVPPS